MDNQNMNQNMNNQQPVYQQPVYQQPVYQQMPSNLEEPVTVGEWIVSFLLLMIPCVNIVLMFIWAFSSNEKKSKSNFFKAYLIITVIVTVIVFIIYAIVGAAAFSAMYNY